MFVKFVTDMIENSVRSGRGKRWSHVSKQIMTYVSLKSPIAASMLSLNLVTPSARTVQRVICDNRLPFGIGDVASFYLRAKQQLTDLMVAFGIPPGKCPFTVGVDETAMTAAFCYYEQRNVLFGTCCHKDRPGQCDSQEVQLASNIEEMEDGMAYLRQIAADYKLGSCKCRCAVTLLCSRFVFILSDVSMYALNPLIQGLPAIPVLMLVTCNSFSVSDVQRIQAMVETRCVEHGLTKEIGPLLGFGSDGDSRRRAVQISECFGHANSGNTPGRFFAVNDPSCVYSCDISTGIPRGIPIQDPHQYVLRIAFAPVIALYSLYLYGVAMSRRVSITCRKHL